MSKPKAKGSRTVTAKLAAPLGIGVLVPMDESQVLPTQLDVVFFRQETREQYRTGPFLKVEDLPLQDPTADRGKRGLYGTHTRGTDLLATSNRDGSGWTIAVEPIRGTWCARFVPVEV